MTRCVLLGLICWFAAYGAAAQDGPRSTSHENAKGGGVEPASMTSVTGTAVPCIDGEAGGFACRNVDLLAFLALDAIGGSPLNDIWGWTDEETGREYALVGRQDGVSFVDVTNPIQPIYLGNLPTHTRANVWRDIKVYRDYALIVADHVGEHGMQVFDLRALRDVEDPPATFSATARYTGVGSAHNVVVNEASGFAYAVAASGGSMYCGPGLHMIDLADPLNPVSRGCFNAVGTGRHGTGYTHDAQCVDYAGPDPEFAGRELCFAANETDLSIVDVTDKNVPVEVGRATYPGVQYAHQGWLTEDHRYFLMDDELDEAVADTVGGSPRTRTMVWDVMEIGDPVLVGVYLADTPSIDHNQYVVNGRSYQANYTAGLRVLDVSDPSSVDNIEEVAYFDTYVADNSIRFEGAWSSYPYFESGTVVVSSINEGLFVLRPTGPASVGYPREVPSTFRLIAPFPNPFTRSTTVTLEVDRSQRMRVNVYDMQGRRVAELFDDVVPAPSDRAFIFDAGGLASGVYVVRAEGDTGTRSVTVILQK